MRHKEKAIKENNYPMKVLLDTNFLIDSIRFKIDLNEMTDLIGAHQLVTLSSVEKELAKISQGRSNAASRAKLALSLIKEHGMGILKSGERPDNAMVKLADEDAVVATNDPELRRRLKALG